MSARRVTMVCSSTLWAGTEKWSLRASEELAKHDVEVTFACREPEVFRPHLRGDADIRFVKLPFRNEADIGTIAGLSKLFRTSDAVILTRVRDYWLGGLAARLTGVPALLRLGIVRRLRDSYLMDRLRYGILPSALLVNAEAIRTTLHETPWMKRHPVHLIYNGVESPGPVADDRKKQLRDAYGVPQGTFWLVGSGRLAVEKRWHLLLEAVARLATKKIPVYATLFGEGSERQRLEARARELDVAELVDMPGYDSNASEVVGAADAMLLPSDNEGVSNTMLEAMGRGVPVVVSASGGVREVFTDGEELLLTNANETEVLIDRVVQLAGKRTLRDRIGSAGMIAVREKFTWQRMGDELLELLAGLTGEGKR